MVTKRLDCELSILIPARNEVYLQATINDIIKKFKTKFEIIVGLDEYWPSPALDDKDPRIVIYHSAERIGMRPMINRLAAIASGKYIMKTDAHCLFDEGYDEKLIAISNRDTTVLGVRYELDVNEWARKERTNCDFRYLSNPKVDHKGGLRGIAWHEYKARTKGQQVSETMTISGSGWLMERRQFERWGGLDENHGTFGQEGCEISLKTWLSGGRVLVNRGTWYAHWNRGKAPYALSTSQRDKSVSYSCDYWLNDRWPLQKYSFQWLIERFAPVPEWTEQSIEFVKAPRVGCLYKGIRAKYKDSDTDWLVKDLWEKRIAICEPLKRERLKIFYNAFNEACEMFASGPEITVQKMERSKYFNYLCTHLPNEHRNPLSEWGKRHVAKKFVGGLGLFSDVKQNGLKAPLEFYVKDGNMVLWRGYRRLIIAHVLGIERIAIVIHKSELTAKKFPRKFTPPIKGSIHALGEKQFLKHGGKATDKYWTHCYLEIYDKLFAKLRNKKIKLLEIGVARGASLALWHEAFPKARIYGLDKNEDIWKEFTSGLDRIKVFIGKQQDVSLLKNSVVTSGPYDIIIDDAGHEPSNQWITFKELWPSVKPHGYYVIEDCFRSYSAKNGGKTCVPEELAKLVRNIYIGHEIMEVQFFYNLCVVRKGIAAMEQAATP